MNTHAHPIDCEEVVARLLEYLDGETDAITHARIERHLEDCRGCYSRAEFEKTLRRKLRALGKEPVPPGLNRRIKDLLDSF